jgi:hypothetical protein
VKFILLVIFFATQALACPDVNLIIQKDSPFEKIPVYDQDGTGICYAYTAAQLKDFYLIKNGASKRSLHPAWIALKYAEKKEKDRITGGDAAIALKAIASGQNCDYDIVSEALQKWSKEANVSEAEILNFLERYAKNLQLQYSSIFQHSTAKPPLALKQPRSILTPDVESAVAQTAQEVKCSTATWDKLIPALKDLEVLTSRELISQLIFPACKSSPQPKHPPVKPHYFASHFTKDAEIESYIKDHLGRVKSPLAISYCSTVLYEPDYDGVNNGLFRYREGNQKKDCGEHASLVVGSKNENNQCHFLLRNTWGNGFGSSTKKWKCLCKHKRTGQFVDNCSYKTQSAKNYSVEGCWIPSDKLSKNVYGLTVIY